MNITVVKRLEADRRRLRDAVVDRVERTLARYAHRVARVNVTLVDENGPRGGVDKRCQVSVVMHGTPEITASAMNENPWRAFTTATERVRQIISRKLSRPRTVRIQEMRRRGTPADTPAAEATMD
ncbi:hypothetical protein Mal4_02550 [Maioricimonas rarisocia]|uniref:Sigma 54 modulation protein / S30EA ribosomal protein n=1 Tax=Maioricimonas rarisocia TaxID=2528026 RepID=A0A517Z0G3_9PLAN|nr:HPF/RaiA family ribosome-associated protein [Maioricimonas rarisocia]QDU35972.1 hypothetical protein Mal4_02550 [Maioricimonas rarisocia]